MKNENQSRLTGVLKSINGKSVNYRAFFEIDEHHRAMVTVFGVSDCIFKEAAETKNSSAILALDRGDYVSLFDVIALKGNQFIKLNGENNDGNATLTLSPAYAIQGQKVVCESDSFNDFSIKLSDGHELIGVCPYDVNPSFMDIVRFRNISIPVNKATIKCETALGKWSFSVFPFPLFENQGVSLCFDHLVQYESFEPIAIKDIHLVFEKLTDFFSILSGELITVNSLSSVGQNEGQATDMYDYIGYCQYPRMHLKVLSDGNGMDATNYLRIALFKLSDFPDVGAALNSWAVELEKPNFALANKAYGRILLDEDVKIVTENKFLAAMQLVEGYFSSVYGNDKLAIFLQRTSSLFT